MLLLLTACGDRAVPSTEEVAATTSADSAVADEVRIDSAAAAEFGIRVDTVASVSGEMLSVTGSVTYDANLVSHIGSRAAGRILTLRADIGDQVTAGSVLAILESPGGWGGAE
ncbi:MAG: efflux RND transporter periplasmic adaptor subunit [Gemmatimonadetes bacterium]|nr:efflux RND transporter periplasmic adaptor subunit [Gemmatimonadota bacterium]